MNDSCLQIKNLGKDFGPKTALSGVTISLEKGEIMGLVGPNGAGKTTLIKLVMGQTAEWGRFFGALFISLVWLAAYYLLGTIISILNREPVTAGIVIGLVGILLSLPGMFAVSRSFSIFYQMRVVDYFVYGQSLFPPLIYGLILNCILLLIGLRVFAKKDF